jgi:flagellar biosynthesis/type III secretory pathway M-ring protein FliF/YscJ
MIWLKEPLWGLAKWAWGLILVALLALFIMSKVFGWVEGEKEELKKALSDENTEAILDTLEEAAKEEQRNADKKATIDQETQNAVEKILEAPVGDRNDATVDAACSLRLYQCSERCARLREARSEKPPAACKGSTSP